MPAEEPQKIAPAPVYTQQQWHAATTLCGKVRGPLHDWLLDSGSLTARLVAKSAGQFGVQLLQQHWHRATLSEAKLLGIAPRARVLVREVILQGKGQPWVFARSILPHSSLQGHLRRLGKFDNRPLGAFLFRQPGMRRGPMQVSHFAEGSGDLPAGLSQRGPAWGRRSVFYIDEKPLLVSEVFLDDFIASL